MWQDRAAASSADDLTITFDAPPLNEVSLGRVFLPRPDLLVPHFGSFWEAIRSEFPTVQHAPTILTMPTGQPEAASALPVLDDGSLLPRVWFISQDEATLVQLQQNRFHFNWRKREDGAYVRFPFVQNRALEMWAKLDEFVGRELKQPLSPVYNELSYINIVEADAGQSEFEVVNSCLRDFKWIARPQRHLAVPRTVNHGMAFRISDDIGDLFVAIASGTKRSTKAPIAKLELTVRGGDPRSSGIDLATWSTKAHDYLVKAFKELTEPTMHSKWKLLEGTG